MIGTLYPSSSRPINKANSICDEWQLNKRPVGIFFVLLSYQLPPNRQFKTPATTKQETGVNLGQNNFISLVYFLLSKHKKRT